MVLESTTTNDILKNVIKINSKNLGSISNLYNSSIQLKEV